MSELMWGIYRLFHQPPGTPKELKCIGCKVACAGASFLSSGVLFWGGKKSARVNGFKSAAMFGLGFLVIGVGATFSRMAYDDNIYNERLTIELQKETRRERLKDKKKDTGGCPVMH